MLCINYPYIIWKIVMTVTRSLWMFWADVLPHFSRIIYSKVLSIYVTFRINEAGLRVPLSSIAPLVPSGILKFVPAFVLSTSCRAWQSDRWPVLPGNSRDMAKSRPGARSIVDNNGTHDDSTGSSSPAHLGCCPAPVPFLSAKRVSQQGQNGSQTIPAISPQGMWLKAWF